MIISIHVPAWGTTKHRRYCHCRNAISIHVPAWGTTVTQATYIGIATFQSTFPRGERPQGFTVF